MAEPTTITGVVVAAAIAALGFVGKELWIIGKAQLDEKRRRRGKLIQLLSQLRGSKASFDTQLEHRSKLLANIAAKYSDLAPSADYETADDYFARAYEKLDEPDRKLHAIIRGITMHALRPLNQSMLKWVQTDRYFKGARDTIYEPLAAPLSQLEIHLLLWLAKYESWIADERRALVYLDDEDQHGVGFPQGIDALVEKAVYGPEGAPRPGHSAA